MIRPSELKTTLQQPFIYLGYMLGTYQHSHLHKSTMKASLDCIPAHTFPKAGGNTGMTPIQKRELKVTETRRLCLRSCGSEPLVNLIEKDIQKMSRLALYPLVLLSTFNDGKDRDRYEVWEQEKKKKKDSWCINTQSMLQSFLLLALWDLCYMSLCPCLCQVYLSLWLWAWHPGGASHSTFLSPISGIPPLLS